VFARSRKYKEIAVNNIKQKPQYSNDFTSAKNNIKKT
jgi:thiamine pyrophosphokinase